METVLYDQVYNVETVLYYVSCHIMYTTKYTMWRRYFTMLVVISCIWPSRLCGDGTLLCKMSFHVYDQVYNVETVLYYVSCHIMYMTKYTM